MCSARCTSAADVVSRCACISAAENCGDAGSSSQLPASRAPIRKPDSAMDFLSHCSPKNEISPLTSGLTVMPPSGKFIVAIVVQSCLNSKVQRKIHSSQKQTATLDAPPLQTNQPYSLGAGRSRLFLPQVLYPPGDAPDGLVGSVLLLFQFERPGHKGFAGGDQAEFPV